MQTAAHAEADVHLGAISGFRTLEHQRRLYERAVLKYRSTAIARQWVAPPGFSEHHTGLALDIGDINVPQTNAEPSFKATPAYRWLVHNAHRFDFELSFPEDQEVDTGDTGIPSYEPWHWRFIGLCP